MPDPVEITSTAFVCNGATGAAVTPGAGGSGFAWFYANGPAQQAASNTGCIAGGAGKVAIVLPAIPAEGEIVKVSDASAGGWKIVQDAGQSIVTTRLADDLWLAKPTAITYGALGQGRTLVASDDGSLPVVVMANSGISTATDCWTSTTSRVQGRFSRPPGAPAPVWRVRSRARSKTRSNCSAWEPTLSSS